MMAASTARRDILSVTVTDDGMALTPTVVEDMSGIGGVGIGIWSPRELLLSSMMNYEKQAYRQT